MTDGLRNNLTERRAGQVKRETRYDYAAAVAMRYQRSGREQKGWILDEFCAATGYNRKYAIKLLRGPFPRAALPPGHGREAPDLGRAGGQDAVVTGRPPLRTGGRVTTPLSKPASCGICWPRFRSSR